MKKRKVQGCILLRCALQERKMENNQTEVKFATKPKEEVSAMAVVVCGNDILTTNEMIYGKEVLSLPKGHVEGNETVVETAIRECFEETDVVLDNQHFAKQLTPFGYEFTTPSGEFIRKTIVPVLFVVSTSFAPVAKEPRMVSTQWMDLDLFLQKASHDNVKVVVRQAKQVLFG